MFREKKSSIIGSNTVVVLILIGLLIGIIIAIPIVYVKGRVARKRNIL
jgi:hypothetical protein